MLLTPLISFLRSNLDRLGRSLDSHLMTVVQAAVVSRAVGVQGDVHFLA